MDYLQDGRKPVEMIAELLRQNAVQQLRMEFRAVDAKNYRADVVASIAGNVRRWQVCEPGGEWSITAKPSAMVETIGRWGVLAMVAIYDGHLLEVTSQPVFEQQQHYQRVVAARRQKTRLEKEQKAATAAYSNLQQQIAMASDWQTSSEPEEAAYYAELQTRLATVTQYRQWLAQEIDALTLLIHDYENGGNPEIGYGTRTETFENIWLAGDPATITLGTLKAGWQITEISIDIGPTLPAAATIAVDAGASNIVPAGMFKLDREIQYEIEPYESFTDDRPITFTVAAAGAGSGAIRILVETSR